MRQVVLDTETTGLDPDQGHRIIEIGCVELVNRRPSGNTFHYYLNPERGIDPGAQEVHGISAEFLADKPRFAEIVDELKAFLRDAELLIHNAPFDVGFLDSEFGLCAGDAGADAINDICPVLDTLVLAREMHPGQRNSLDALCRRYQVDNSGRELHGALLDAQILAEVYLAMTGGQAALSLDNERRSGAGGRAKPSRLDRAGLVLPVIEANAEELAAHEAVLDRLDKASDGVCVWRRLQSEH
ncbi:MAG: DNA polymerase III subunit epsilon [Gammaproteobacteria bacterium]